MQDVASADTGSQPTPSSRRSARDQRHDWAHDRSPLQKLEVTLGGLSKEEKRARAQEAELKLQERLARKDAERDTRQAIQAVPRGLATAEDMSPKAANLERTSSNRKPRDDQSAAPHGRDIQVAKPQEPNHLGLDSYKSRVPEGKRRPEEPNFARSRTQSLNYPAVRPAKQPLYANDERPVGAVRRGSAPKRSVTVSNQPGAHDVAPHSGTRGFPGRTSFSSRQAGELPIPTKTSEQTSPKTREPPVHPDSGDRRTSQIQQPYGAEISGPYTTPNEGPMSHCQDPMHAQNGVSPQSKPKRQTVSFDVPPSVPPPVAEWKNAPVARLCASDFDFQNIDVSRSKAWWEGGSSANRRKSRALPNEYHAPVQKPKGKFVF